MSSLSLVSLINLIKKSIPLCSPGLTKTQNYLRYQHLHLQSHVVSATSFVVRKSRQYAMHGHLISTRPTWQCSSFSDPLPEIPQRRIQEVDPATPPEMPEIRSPPEIDPARESKVIIPTPEEIGPLKPAPDPTPDPSGPDFPHPPIPSPPEPDVIPPPDVNPPPRQPPDVVPPTPPDVFPPPSTPPPDIAPPTGPIIV